MNLEVQRSDLRTWRVVDQQPEVGDHQARLRVDRFALTANNVTYAVFGDTLYWRFFPAVEDGWGRVPAWGFAEVEQTRAEGVAQGDRVYGYFPMATHLVVTPDRINDNGFSDATPHRAGLPPIYNHYRRVATDAVYDASREGEISIFRPLFTTSFLIDDWLAEAGMFDASVVVLGSASSKTALGLAYLLSARSGVDVVGLTSPRNADFVRDVGYYSRVVVYDAVTELSPDTPTVFVDMAGDGQVRSAVHNHLGAALRKSSAVGATHWPATAAPAEALPGPSPERFFAPDYAGERRAEWGGEEFDRRLATAWAGFLDSVAGWLSIEVHTGPDAVGAAWLSLLDGTVPPYVGYVASMH